MQRKYFRNKTVDSSKVINYTIYIYGVQQKMQKYTVDLIKK